MNQYHHFANRRKMKTTTITSADLQNSQCPTPLDTLNKGRIQCVCQSDNGHHGDCNTTLCLMLKHQWDGEACRDSVLVYTYTHTHICTQIRTCTCAHTHVHARVHKWRNELLVCLVSFVILWGWWITSRLVYLLMFGGLGAI